jgi:hypothetical protein
MASIPRVFHFVYGLRPQLEPFPLMHYLCLRSCLDVNAPERIDFHTLDLPWGPWWDLIRPWLNVRGVEPSRFIEGHPAYCGSAEGRLISRNRLQYAHHADFIRLEILLEEGGVYADIDTLFVEPIPAGFFHESFVMAPEGFRVALDDGTTMETLCNALMMSAPEAEFAQTWYERMFAVFDGTWNRHSCLEAGLLARTTPHLLPDRAATAFLRGAAERRGDRKAVPALVREPCGNQQSAPVGASVVEPGTQGFQRLSLRPRDPRLCRGRPEPVCAPRPALPLAPCRQVQSNRLPAPCRADSPMRGSWRRPGGDHRRRPPHRHSLPQPWASFTASRARESTLPRSTILRNLSPWSRCFHARWPRRASASACT